MLQLDGRALEVERGPSRPGTSRWRGDLIGVRAVRPGDRTATQPVVPVLLFPWTKFCGRPSSANSLHERIDARDDAECTKTAPLEVAPHEGQRRGIKHRAGCERGRSAPWQPSSHGDHEVPSSKDGLESWEDVPATLRRVGSRERSASWWSGPRGVEAAHARRSTSTPAPIRRGRRPWPPPRGDVVGPSNAQCGPAGSCLTAPRWTTNLATCGRCSPRPRTPRSSWSTWPTPPSTSATRTWPRRSTSSRSRCPSSCTTCAPCRVLAARNPKEAEAMASVLQVISAIERIGNDAVDIARIVTHRLGIPRELVADLSKAEEVSHRVLVREGSTWPTGRSPPSSCRCRPACGSWPSAAGATGSPTSTARRSAARRRAVPARPAGRHPPAARARRGALLGAAGPARGRHAHRPRPRRRRARRDEEHLRGRRRPGLLGARAARPGLAAEVRHLEDRLDEMKDRLEVWVLRASNDRIDPRRCAACCTCRRRPRTSATPPSRWCG